MVKPSFEIVCDLIQVCETFGYSFTLESNKVGDYRLIIGFSLSGDSNVRLMSGSFAFAVLKVVDGCSNVTTWFNAESAFLNISVWYECACEK